MNHTSATQEQHKKQDVNFVLALPDFRDQKTAETKREGEKRSNFFHCES